MKFDKTINTAAERIDYVKGLLENGESFSNTNLERMADYILIAKDAPRDKKQKYNYYTNWRLFRKALAESEIQLDHLGQSEHSENNIDTIDIYISQAWGKHHIISKDQVIAEVDKHDELIGSAILDYDNVIKTFKDRDCYKCKKYVTSTKADQILYKTQIKGTIYLKHISQGSTVTAWNMFNFTNENHIIELLKFSLRPLKGSDSVNLSELIFDLNNLLEMCDLSANEKFILKLWRDEDATQQTIAENLGVTQQNISKYLNSIVCKVKQQYEIEHEDWLNLNYLKGTYKKCSKCGEVKLISKFDLDCKNKDSLKTKCKTCRQKRL